MVSLVVPVRTSTGAAAALKLQWPHRESEHEAAALAMWDGHGAVRLLDHASDLHALVLERCVPGTPLSRARLDEAIDAMVDIVAQLSSATGAGTQITTLAAECAGWRARMESEWEQAGRPFERELLDRVLALLDELPAGQGAQVLVHQDLHADNVLRSERGWLAIDPKPLVGEAAFTLAGFLRSFDYWAREAREQPRAFGEVHGPASVRRRLDETSVRLELDRSRVRDWSVAQLIAWCFDSSWRDLHVQTARWLLEM
jgi:streptomycin 6-kinase